jgi:hypothetical protein
MVIGLPEIYVYLKKFGIIFPRYFECLFRSKFVAHGGCTSPKSRLILSDHLPSNELKPFAYNVRYHFTLGR